jgi:hypothetical protein
MRDHIGVCPRHEQPPLRPGAAGDYDARKTPARGRLRRGGSIGNLHVVAVTETALELETFGDARVTVNRAELWELRVPEVSRGKRAAIIGGIATAVWFMLLDDAGYELDF